MKTNFNAVCGLALLALFPAHFALAQEAYPYRESEAEPEIGIVNRLQESKPLLKKKRPQVGETMLKELDESSPDSGIHDFVESFYSPEEKVRRLAGVTDEEFLMRTNPGLGKLRRRRIVGRLGAEENQAIHDGGVNRKRMPGVPPNFANEPESKLYIYKQKNFGGSLTQE